MDPLNDPRFPDRPQHPDFWRMVGIVNYLDGEALEGGRDPEKIVGEYVDMDSLIYLAKQRVLRLRGHIDPAAGLALYMDAFAVGYKFHEEKTDE